MADILTALAPLTKEINRTIGFLLTQDEEIVSHIGRYNFEGGGNASGPSCSAWPAKPWAAL